MSLIHVHNENYKRDRPLMHDLPKQNRLQTDRDLGLATVNLSRLVFHVPDLYFIGLFAAKYQYRPLHASRSLGLTNPDSQTARLTTSYCAPSWSELITNMQNGAQCRSLVYSSGQWCTTWSCTVELVHNVCLTNPEGRTDATKCITSPSLQSINIDLKSYSSKEGPSQSSYRIGRSAHFKCKFNSDLFHRQGLSIYLDYKTTYIIKN